MGELIYIYQDHWTRSPVGGCGQAAQGALKICQPEFQLTNPETLKGFHDYVLKGCLLLFTHDILARADACYKLEM